MAVNWAGFAELQQRNNPTQDLMGNFAQGYQTGAQINALQQRAQLLQAQRQKAEQEAIRQQKMFDDFTNAHAITDPRLKVKTLSDLAILYPDMGKQLNESASAVKSEIKETIRKDYAPAFNAFMTGQNEIGVRFLTDKEQAFRNAGDVGQADQLKYFIDSVKNAPDQALTTATMFMMENLGVDEFKNTFDPDATQKIIGMPFEQRKTVAQAITAEGEANRQPFLTQEAQAKATQEGVKAQYADELARLDVQNQKANLELTNKQKLQAVAAARKINTEVEQMTKKVNKGMIDITDPEKRFKFEMDLRNQYQKEAGEFFKTRDAYDRISSIYNQYLKPDAKGKVVLPKGETAKTRDAIQAAGDIGLIFNYMKMLDPGSTVREGEFATAANAAGVPDKILNLYNKVATGERLTPDQRSAYYNQANALFKTSKSRADEVKNNLTSYAKNYSLNTENIFSAPKGIVTRDK